MLELSIGGLLYFIPKNILKKKNFYSMEMSDLIFTRTTELQRRSGIDFLRDFKP